jgi:hypothetical protein
MTTTPTKTIAELREEAAQLLERGWTKYTFAQDANGQPVGPFSDKAVCWCMAGAIRRVSGQPGASPFAYAEVYDAVAAELARDGHALSRFNDAPGRTQARSWRRCAADPDMPRRSPGLPASRKARAYSAGWWRVAPLPPRTTGCRDIGPKRGRHRQGPIDAVLHTTGDPDDAVDYGNAVLAASAPRLLALTKRLATQSCFTTMQDPRREQACADIGRAPVCAVCDARAFLEDTGLDRAEARG